MSHDRSSRIRIRLASIAVLAALLAACGGGDGGEEIKGVDHGVDDPNRFLEYFDMQDGEIGSAAYARAYYDAVDPGGARTTLAAWKQASGFNGCDVSVITVKFRDTKDLGYGRHMRVCTDTGADDGFAAFVDNYQVDPIPELAYSELNLEAVLEEDRKWLLGTNAIEFSPPEVCPDGATPGASCSTPIAKFFTFEPPGSDGVQDRAIKANLDGRGDRYMPHICVQCHGGRLLPLENADGELPRLRTSDNLGLPGDVEAKLQPLLVDTFDFPESGTFSRASQEEALRRINAAVHASYGAGDYGGSGEWYATFGQSMVDGWYSGDVTVTGRSFDSGFVPTAWEPDTTGGNPPPGSDDLFTDVVVPRCMVCHMLRGTTLQSDVQFATYSAFEGHAAQIERLVYDEALMPAALLQFDRFWEDGEESPEAAFLGTFLDTSTNTFTHGNSDGTVDVPGQAVADAGPDRTVAGLPLTLSAEDSAFAVQYSWEITGTTVNGATLSNADRARAELSGSGDGDVTVRLTVIDRKGRADGDTATITVDTAATLSATNGNPMPAPRDIAFSDIEAVLQDVTAGCDGCHVDGGGYDGIPLHYDAGSATEDYAGGDAVYARVVARVNARDPKASLILRKPSGNHHAGLQRPGFDADGAASDHLAYDMFYTWILEGAPEN